MSDQPKVGKPLFCAVFLNMQRLRPEIHTEQLRAIARDESIHAIFLSETWHRPDDWAWEKIVTSSDLRDILPMMQCFDVACICREPEHCEHRAFHGMCCYVRRGLQCSMEKVKLGINLAKYDHRQIFVRVKMPSGFVANLTGVHYKSGGKPGPLDHNFKLLQVMATIKHLLNSGKCDAMISGGDYNYDPWTPGFGEAQYLYEKAGFSIESFRQVRNPDPKKKVSTHVHNGKDGGFLDHISVKLDEKYAAVVTLLGPKQYVVTTDHPYFLKVEIWPRECVEPVLAPAEYEYEFQCAGCGRGYNCESRIHDPCKYPSEEVVEASYIQLLEEYERKEGLIEKSVSNCRNLDSDNGSGRTDETVGTSRMEGTCGTKRKKMTEKKTDINEPEISPDKITCDKCSIVFSAKKGLKKHMREVCNRPLEIQCQECGKVMKSNRSLVVHERTHTENLEALCDRCGKLLTNTKSLRIHVLEFCR